MKVEGSGMDGCKDRACGGRSSCEESRPWGVYRKPSCRSFVDISGDNNIESRIACFQNQKEDAIWEIGFVRDAEIPVGDLAAGLWSGPEGYRPNGLPPACRW